MALDHGLLNIPLSKRGNIDTQIDRYKAEQAIIAKGKRASAAAQTKADRIAAKAKLQNATAEKLSALAGRLNVTVAALRKRLASDAHWQPEIVLGLDVS